MRRYESRSAEAQAYRPLYNSARWRRRRADHLAAHPLCTMCKAAGRVTAGTVADHVTPHRGDPELFFHGELQTLCDADPWRCHSRTKQREERHGFSPNVGSDGWPVDPNHRANLLTTTR